MDDDGYERGEAMEMAADRHADEMERLETELARTRAELDDAQGMRESWAATSAQWEDRAKELDRRNVMLREALTEALEGWEWELEDIAAHRAASGRVEALRKLLS